MACCAAVIVIISGTCVPRCALLYSPLLFLSPRLTPQWIKCSIQSEPCCSLHCARVSKWTRVEAKEFGTFLDKCKISHLITTRRRRPLQKHIRLHQNMLSKEEKGKNRLAVFLAGERFHLQNLCPHWAGASYMELTLPSITEQRWRQWVFQQCPSEELWRRSTYVAWLYAAGNGVPPTIHILLIIASLASHKPSCFWSKSIFASENWWDPRPNPNGSPWSTKPGLARRHHSSGCDIYHHDEWSRFLTQKDPTIKQTQQFALR